MSQVCDGYTANCLMGNWSEERLAPVQPQRNQAHCPVRELDPNVSFADDFGNLLPLERMKRAQPWVTSDLLVSSQDQQRISNMRYTVNLANVKAFSLKKDHRSINKMFGSTKDVQFPDSNPHHVQVLPAKIPKLFNDKTKSEMTVARQTDQGSFKSLLKPNSIMNQHFYSDTTYKCNFGIKELPAINASKVAKPMVGERLRENTEPKQNTAVQRSWYPGVDLGLYYSKLSKEQQKAKEGAGEGEAQKNFRRIRSEITMQWTKPINYR